MQSFVQPKCLARAGVASLVTLLVSWPWLAIAPRHVEPVWFAGLAYSWCLFILWGFVFAWHTQYSQRPVFLVRFHPKLWLAATAYAAACAALAFFFLDPVMREMKPTEYPTDFNHWLALGLFTLGFSPLFFTLAPFDFFLRLCRRTNLAVGLTVVSSLFFETVMIHQHGALPPPFITVSYLLLQVLGTFVSIYFYLNGGILLVWWIHFLVHLRLVVQLS